MAELHLMEFVRSVGDRGSSSSRTFCQNVRRWILKESSLEIYSWLTELRFQISGGLKFENWVAYQHYRHTTLNAFHPALKVAAYGQFSVSCVPLCRGSDHKEWDWSHTPVSPPQATDWTEALLSAQESLEEFRKRDLLQTLLAQLAADLMLRSAYELEVHFSDQCPPTLFVRTVFGLQDLGFDALVCQQLDRWFGEYVCTKERVRSLDLPKALQLEKEKYKTTKQQKQ